MDQKRIEEVFSSDESLMKRLLESENLEGVQAELKEKGIEIGLDEINSIRTIVANSGDGTEIPLDQLEAVAGGVVTIAAAAAFTAKAAASGIIAAVAKVATEKAMGR